MSKYSCTMAELDAGMNKEAARLDRLAAERKRKTAVFFLATNDELAVSSWLVEDAYGVGLKVGANELTADQAELLARDLASCKAKNATGRKRRQVARMLWDLHHGPYDAKPEWLRGEP